MHIVKKKLFIPVSIVIIAIGIFWLVLKYDYSGLEFVDSQGSLAAGPIIEQSGDIYTITWSTKMNYPNNEVVMKHSPSLYSNTGVGADSVYDSLHDVYVHTVRFRLSNDHVINSALPIFAPGQYTYQVKSSGLSDQGVVVSEILSL